jgi:hypothetical protein
MKNLLAIAFAAASLMTAPVAFVATSSGAIAQQQCVGPNVPEAWLRPGGFCDQLNNKGSVIEQNELSCRGLPLETMLIGSLQNYGDRILVAEDCYFSPELPKV